MNYLFIKNKTMKKISLMIVMVLILSGAVYSQERGGGQRPSAQQERGGGERPSKSSEANKQDNRGDRQMMTPEQRLQRQTQQLVEQLKLTKEQELKVTAINKKYQEKQSFDWSKMRDASDDERKKMRDAMVKIQTERDNEIKTILTPDQVKLYEDILKKREERRKNNQGRWDGRSSGQQ